MNKVITQQQVEEVLKVLQEVPAKFSYAAINILINLPNVIEQKDQNEPKL